MVRRLPIASTGRIIVVRSLPGLGDLLCSVPALRALRAAFPLAHITLLGLPGTKWFADRFASLLDDWIAFPGYPGIPEGWQGVQAIPSFLAQMQAQAFDAAIQLHGNGCYMNSFTTLLGAKCNSGFFVPGQFCPDPQRFLPYSETESEVWRLLRLMELLEFPLQGDELEFPIWDAEAQSYHQIAIAHHLEPGTYICLHAGANSSDRRWSPEGFAKVADALAGKGYRIVLTGTAAEQPVVTAVMQAMQMPSLNLAGYTDLGTLAALLQQAALLICNDTGVSHLAAALKVPSVVIFSNSEVRRWAPLDRNRHRVVCHQKSGYHGSNTVTVTTVLQQAQDLLGQNNRSLSEPSSDLEVSYV